MKKNWTIEIPSEEKERIAITYGDPADALVAVDNYALYPLPDAISNWHAITPLIEPDHWYDVTAFYSKRKTNLSKEKAKLLYDYNQQAFDAAKTKGGLILYYQGVLISDKNKKTLPDLNLSFIPNCLSFCIWETLAVAKEGAKIPEHKEASKMVSLWYEGFALVKYKVILKVSKDKKMLLFQNIPYSRT